MSLLPQAIAFAATVAALLFLSRWITRHVQVLGLLLTGDERAAQMVYYLLMLPGIVLHELSHVVVARLVGLRVGHFSIGPRPRGDFSVELGSVTVSRADVFRESLVGLAPFVTGTAVLVLVGYRVFDVDALSAAWAADGLGGLLQASRAIWQAPDFALWAYLIFVVSNAMTPSASDRQPWFLAGIYVAVALAVAYLLIGLPALPGSLSAGAAIFLQVLTLAFLFTLILDLLVAAVMWAAEGLILALRRSPPGGA